MRTVVAFDFDGTLTTRDTFPAFIRFSLGFWRFAVGLALFAPMLVAMKGGFYPNWKVKQRVFSHFFKGMSVGRFDAYCEDFCRDRLPRMLRKQLLQTVREYTGGKYELCVVSASIDRWIRPWAETAGFTRLLCTEVETENGVLTGRFSTPNCYGTEKVRRLQSAYPDRKEYRLIAYGDSRGDREMLSYADEHYFINYK